MGLGLASMVPAYQKGSEDTKEEIRTALRKYHGGN